jgi:hypothetical protein
MSELFRLPLLTAEEIANSPSRADGVSAAIEEQNLKRAAKIISGTARAVPSLEMPM